MLRNTLESTAGWRARQEIGTLAENARMSFSAAVAYEENKEWYMMLIELADGIKEARELSRVLRRHLESVPAVTTGLAVDGAHGKSSPAKAVINTSLQSP